MTHIHQHSILGKFYPPDPTLAPKPPRPTPVRAHQDATAPADNYQKSLARLKALVKRLNDPDSRSAASWAMERGSIGIELIDLVRIIFSKETATSDDPAMDLLLSIAENAALADDSEKKDREIARLKREVVITKRFVPEDQRSALWKALSLEELS